MVVLLWTGCKNEGTNEPTQEVTFPISICLPADEVLTGPLNGPKRVMGDPGTTENFLLPNHIYIFIVNKVAEDTWKVWDQMTIDDASEYWQKEYYTGELMGSGDSIYRLTRAINSRDVSTQSLRQRR